jgi:hypothetical protein
MYSKFRFGASYTTKWCLQWYKLSIFSLGSTYLTNSCSFAMNTSMKWIFRFNVFSKYPLKKDTGFYLKTPYLINPLKRDLHFDRLHKIIHRQKMDLHRLRNHKRIYTKRVKHLKRLYTLRTSNSRFKLTMENLDDPRIVPAFMTFPSSTILTVYTNGPLSRHIQIFMQTVK